MHFRKKTSPCQLLSHIVMTKHLQISWQIAQIWLHLHKTRTELKKPSLFSSAVVFTTTICLDILGDFCVVALLWGGPERCEQCHCLQGVWQVVCAACKPPDVSETSHWRRRREEAGGLQQQAEWADYHGGLDAIRSPGQRQQIWHTPGLQDCPLEKIKRILYMRAETSWQWCRMHRQVLFPQSRLLDLTTLLAGVDAIRVVTIQAQCHVMRQFFFFLVFQYAW